MLADVGGCWLAVEVARSGWLVANVGGCWLAVEVARSGWLVADVGACWLAVEVARSGWLVAGVEVTDYMTLNNLMSRASASVQEFAGSIPGRIIANTFKMTVLHGAQVCGVGITTECPD